MDAYEKMLQEELVKYKQLFYATHKLHTYLDKDKILNEIIFLLEEIFPQYRFNLHLIDKEKMVPDAEEDKLNFFRAYTTGKIQVETCKEKIRRILYVPLIGKNGVNGVIQVTLPNLKNLSKSDIEILSLFTETTGNALDNAALVQTNSLLRDELEHMIITDHLTKLHSRKYLDENIQYSMKDDQEGTFILIDIDNFKEINDTFGHQVGDEVLIQVANLIKKNIRENDVGARWGGEELAVYLPKVSIQEGLAIAERLVKAIAESTLPKITVSCGVSYWNKESIDTYKYLFKRADEALYLAKGSGKNKVVVQKTA